MQNFAMVRTSKTRLLITLFFMLAALNVSAKKNAFMRVYLLGSASTISGFYVSHTDSAIIVAGRHHTDTINYALIQRIRQGRSRGHTILLGSIIGTLTGAIAGAVFHQDPAGP